MVFLMVSNGFLMVSDGFWCFFWWYAQTPAERRKTYIFDIFDLFDIKFSQKNVHEHCKRYFLITLQVLNFKKNVKNVVFLKMFAQTLFLWKNGGANFKANLCVGGGGAAPGGVAPAPVASNCAASFGCWRWVRCVWISVHRFAQNCDSTGLRVFR